MSKKIRITIRPPRGEKGKFSLILDKINDVGERTQETLYPEELKVVNQKLKEKKLDYNSALSKVEDIKKDYLERLEVESGIRKKIVTCEENLKLFKQYWDREYLNRDIEEESLKSAEYQFRSILQVMGDISFYTCSLAQLKSKLNNSGYSLETKRHLVHKFNILLREAGNKVQLSKPEKQFDEISHINSKELELLSKALDNETVRALLYIGFYTGLRQGEIWALNRTVIDFNRCVIKVQSQITRKGLRKNPKENKRRSVIFPKHIVPYLEYWLDFNQDERKEYRFKVSRVLRETSKKLWPKRTIKHISIHDLRRSFVIYCLQEIGMNLSECAMLIGDTLTVLQSNYAGYTFNDDGLESLKQKYNL